ncbi:allantoate amidohydrolase, partial [Streptomyces sp. ALB3]
MTPAASGGPGPTGVAAGGRPAMSGTTAGRAGGSRPAPAERNGPGAESRPLPEPESFDSMWRGLAPIGLDPGSGGYPPYAWAAARPRCPAGSPPP